MRTYVYGARFEPGDEGGIVVSFPDVPEAITLTQLAFELAYRWRNSVLLIGDYYLIRKATLDLPSLYRRDGPYWFSGGFHLAAVAALVLGILPCVPGFLDVIKVAQAPSFFKELYHYAWFVSFVISLSAYYGLTKLSLSPAGEGDILEMGKA